MLFVILDLHSACIYGGGLSGQSENPVGMLC